MTTGTMSATDALTIENLDVDYRLRARLRRVLYGLNRRIGRGESYGLVGESGCGKSTAALAAVRYLPRNGSVTGGPITLARQHLLQMKGEELRHTRANAVSMVYQEPGKALNPSIRIGRQVAEVFEVSGSSGKDATRRAREILAQVQIADPDSVMDRYPHQLSGGMQQ